MKYLSVCSGIEAATVAWHPLGWQPVAFAEVDAFPSAVLRHHYPTVPNWGDMTKFQEWPDAAVDVLVGGTPCQSFSVAGLRAGLADPRGNLALTFLAIADKYRPRWVVWENVPGVLSALSHPAPDPCPPPPPLDLGCDGAEVDTDDEYDSEELHAFNSFLAGFSELGYLGGYFSLDAQYAGLAQRRERVFAIFHLGDWRRAAAVLFERESLSGHPAPRREAGQDVTARALCSTDGGVDREDRHTLIASDVAGTLGQFSSSGRSFGSHPITDSLIAHGLRADGADASEDGTGRGTPIIPIDMRQASRGATMTNNRAGGCSGGAPGTGIGEAGDPAPTIASSHVPAIAFSAKDHSADAGNLAPAPRADAAGRVAGSHANGGCMPAVAFDTTQITSKANYSNPKPGDPCHPLASTAHPPAVAFDWQSGGDSRGLDPKDTAQLQRCQAPALHHGMQVRRLTPRECERLQGFPDFYTAIPYRGKPAADGPRYKALGNSMAVPVMRWIGSRIALVEEATA